MLYMCEAEVICMSKVVKAVFACRKGKYREGKCSEAVEIQSLLFEKSRWGEEEAKKWAEEHGFRAEKVESSKSGRYWRIRQHDPGLYDPQSFRIKVIAGEEDVHEGEKKNKKEEKKMSKRREFLKKLEEAYWEDYAEARKMLDENKKAREAFARWLASYVKDELSMGIRDFIDGRGRVVIGDIDELMRRWLRWERRR